MPNISRSKNDETIKFGQLMKNIILQKSYRKYGKATTSRTLSVFIKSSTRGKTKCSLACFQYVSIALNLAYNKNKLYWLLIQICILNFDFLEKGLVLCMVFEEKGFLSCVYTYLHITLGYRIKIQAKITIQAVSK